MKILAVLQNQWFNDPVGAQRIYDRHVGDFDRRAKLNRAYLFMGSLTGRRLRTAFGDLCDPDGIIWEEASPQKAGQSSGVFPADVPHLCTVINHHKPDIVVAFGRIATDGVLAAMGTLNHQFHFMSAPHPAARHATVAVELAGTAIAVKSFLKKEDSHA